MIGSDANSTTTRGRSTVVMNETTDVNNTPAEERAKVIGHARVAPRPRR
jgi:hypothetical protein